MTQYKDIPQPTDNRNVSQGDILHNFEYLVTPLNPPGGLTPGILNVDHIATANNVGSADGFHKQISMTSLAAPANLTNATNGQNSDGVTHVLNDANGFGQLRHFTKLAATPTFIDYQVTPCLPLRASINFGWDSGGAVIVTRSSYNCTIARTSTGKFTISFTLALPSNNYIVVFGAMRSDTSSNGDCFGFIQGQILGNYGTSCSTTQLLVGFQTGNQNLNDPTMASVMVFGG